MKDNLEKILVRYYSDVLEEETVETLWAQIIDQEKGLYKVDNIPFYGPKFSSEDIIYAEYDEIEEFMTFRNVVEPSGNSTLQVIIIGENTEAQKIRDIFFILGCESEGLGKNYFVMEVPFELDYHEIFEKLSNLEEEGIISFAEPVISDKHRLEK